MGLLSAVAPQWALRREVARRRLEILNLGYSRHGASRTRKALLGWFSKAGSPDDDITENQALLRERSRDLYMGTPVATGALKTIRTNVVGQGLRLNAQVDTVFLGLSQDDADAWEASVEREFSLWADTQQCDAARTNTFGQIQALAMLSMLMSGDAFAILPIIPRRGCMYDLRVQLIESDRVCDPPLLQGVQAENICAGVEMGQYGEPVAYYVAKYHPGKWQDSKGQATSTMVTLGTASHPVLRENEWKRVLAFGSRSGRRNILHLMEQERPEQRRGVPVLAPVVEALKQLGRYTEAELMAAVVSGFFTVFVKSENPEEGMPETLPEEQQVDRSDTNSVELGNGAVANLRPGESVDVANPGRPNTAFDGFVTAVLRQVGSALEVPYELLIKHFTASYSASRAALLEAWKMFRARRDWLATSFCQPVYEEWLAEAVAKGRIVAPGFFDDPTIRAGWSKAEWYGPTAGQINPLDEVRAAVIRVDEGFSTRARETAELTGSDWERIHHVRVREERMRREGGVIVPKAGAPKAGASKAKGRQE